MDAPPPHSSAESASLSLDGEIPAPSQACKGYALPPLSESSSLASSTTSPTSAGTPAEPPFILLDIPSLPATSVGALAGMGAAQTGVFEILADASGALIAKSGVHHGLLIKPPTDRISVYVWWWGFEIALPPPAIKTLSSVASVQQSFFSFLQAFILAGGASFCLFPLLLPETDFSLLAGAPELAPLARYLSSYLDMEWSAIRAQNKGALLLTLRLFSPKLIFSAGNGVVLAATWLLPVVRLCIISCSRS
jgi:hypothetical protein